MKQHKSFFIENFLNKSNEAFIDVEINLKNNRLCNAQNRIYYAIFYSVIALGYVENFITSKHKQLMGWFNKKFIYEDKIFNKKMYQIYKEAYENRQEADYSFSLKPEKDMVIKSYNDSKLFVKNVSDYINKKIKN